MTGSAREKGGWDEARIDAAYRAAFGAPAPGGLAMRVADGLAMNRRRATSSFGWRPELVGLAAAAVVIIVLAVGAWIPAIGPAASQRSGTPSGPGTSLNEPSSASTSSPTSAGIGWPFPDTVSTPEREYPVIGVADALQVRAATSAPEEIAVGGWQSNGSAHFCAFVPSDPVSILQSACVNDRWLGERPQPNTLWSYAPPREPAFRIFSASHWHADDRTDIHAAGSAVGVVFVGHFHDAMTGDCRAETRQLCDSTFVVDEVPWTFSTTGHRVAPGATIPEPMSVADALTIRDSGSSVEIAVGGWFVGYAVPCPHPPTDYFPLEDCLFDFTWLTADPEDLEVVASDGSGSIRTPTGPAFSVATYGRGDPPAFVVLVGHFNDPGAAQCPAGPRRLACAARFVVDESYPAVASPSP